MTYSSYELSTHSAYPQELFYFQAGATTWAYCAGDDIVVYSSLTFNPSHIKRSALSISDDFAKSDIEVSVDKDNELGQVFISGVPGGVLSLTIIRYHRPDNPNTAGNAVILWKGRITSATINETGITLQGESVFTSLQRPGLRATYTRTCRHALFDTKCTVPSSAWVTYGTVNGISGDIVYSSTAAMAPDGWFTGGVLRFGGYENRLITWHQGTTLVLFTPIASLYVGAPISFYAGCDHTLATCTSKYNNYPNFGGWPFIPTKNPFSGDGIA